MNKILLYIVTAVTLLFFSQAGVAQSVNLGGSADFVFFTSAGAVSNTGITHATGNIGTNNGSSTAFGNVDGVMHDNDGVSAQCAADVLIAYQQLNTKIPEFFISALMGGGQKLNAGVYKIDESASLNGILTLDAQNDANAQFIFQIQGAFSTGALSEVVLLNGAKACNVFWKVEGLVSLSTGTKMKGTVLANNSAIVTYSGVDIEGRLLSTTGALTVSNITAYLPTGCNSLVLTGPTAPNLGSTSCYALLSASGGVTNTGISEVTGDVGTNVGLTTGFDMLNVNGTIHPIADVSTASAAADLLVAYNYINTMPYDIKLLFPAQFGRNLSLTPHTYLLDGATQFTDSLYLNAQGNADAVFVIKINGALITSTYAKVLLVNGAQAKNVYWKVEGAVEINNFSEFKGTIITNNGAINLKTSTKLEGRAMTTNGALATAAVTVTTTSPCGTNSVSNPNIDKATVYTIPGFVVVVLNNEPVEINSRINIYNALGKMVLTNTITQDKTTIDANLPSGIYFYKMMNENKTVQSGKLILN